MKSGLFCLLAFPITLTSFSQDKKFSVCGRRLTATMDEGRFTLLSSRGDTLLYSADYHVWSEIRDFDHDGNKDILLLNNVMTAGSYDLYLYDRKSGKFRYIENSDNYPSPERIKGTKYYYSYFSRGCADDSWSSNLFYIENFKIVRVGLINGEGCGIKDGIYIYRLTKGKERLLKTLPLNTIKKYKAYKWGFLKSYWTRKCKYFP